jgi:hypothetical protein
MEAKPIMVFQIPEGLHQELNPLAWMVGTWRGKGRGEYPNIDPFEFAQEVVFNHDGRNFLNYFSRSWNILEVVIAHNTGISEGWVGTYDGPKIQLVLDRGYAAPSAKVVSEGIRLYGLVAGELFFAYDMAAEGSELQAHIWSSLERQSD